MTRGIHRLSTRSVATLKKAGRYSDGGGLYLSISQDRRRWVFRFTKNSRVREMGLGAVVGVTLAEARKKAAEAQREVVRLRTSGEFIFSGQRYGKPLSSATLETTLRKMKDGGATIHGFRSSFRDWAGNETNFPREVCEVALAHSAGDSTEQAYRRSDSLEKRRALMESWASYCGPQSDNIIPIMARR